MTIDVAESLRTFAPVGVLVIGTIGVLANLKSVLDLTAQISGYRPRLHVTPTITGAPDHGNFLNVANMSAKPAMIDHWQLVWVYRRWFRPMMDVYEEASADFEWEGVTIGGHARSMWQFVDGDWFNVHSKLRDGQVLMFRLIPVGGGRAYNLRVYPFKSSWRERRWRVPGSRRKALEGSRLGSLPD